MSIVAEHVTRVKASEVSVVSAKALELERQGRDIIRLSAGEPDFATPDHIKMACVKALCDNKTKYPPVIGLPELREAICMKLKRDIALEYAPMQTIVRISRVARRALTAFLPGWPRSCDRRALRAGSRAMSYPCSGSSTPSR